MRNLKQVSTFTGTCSLILTSGLALMQADVFPVDWIPALTKAFTVLGALVGVNGGIDIFRDEKLIKPVSPNMKSGTMMSIFLICMLFIPVTMLIGCSLAPMANDELKAEICLPAHDGQPAEESVILDLIPNAEKVDLILRVGNYAALRNKVYTRAQVEKVFKECEIFLGNKKTDITGAQVVAYVTKKIEWLKTNVGQDIIFISQFSDILDVPRVLTTCDRRILLKQFTKHRSQVLSFF